MMGIIYQVLQFSSFARYITYVIVWSWGSLTSKLHTEGVFGYLLYCTVLYVVLTKACQSKPDGHEGKG